MQNASFEQVSGSTSPALDGFFTITAPGSAGWNVRETAALSGVPSWRTTYAYPVPTGYPWVQVVDNGVYLGQNTTHGNRFALVPGWLGNRPQEIVGKLAAPTGAGQGYVMSVDIAKLGMAQGPTARISLRNSATGLQSPQLVQGAGVWSIDWSRLVGTVSGSASYDEVVLRFQETPNDYWSSWYGASTWLALADDLRVCKAAALSAAAPGWWTTARAVATTAVGVVLAGLGLLLRRRLSRRAGPS